MSYKNLEDCLEDLKRNGDLLVINEEVDPNVEIAAIHLRVHEQRGPAILFNNVKGTRYRAASNIFGTLERSKYIFRDALEDVRKLVQLRNDPMKALKNPFKNIASGLAAIHALPVKKNVNLSKYFEEITIDKLPLIKHWPMDGGAFVTLPQVYTEDPEHPGISGSNLGMYRIQLTGNDYILNEEAGLHYQLHRGIGVHQQKAAAMNIPFKVSVFVGGPPAHSVAAVMPLPEGLSELMFAGVLNKRRFRYTYDEEGYCVSLDADFVITGEVLPGAVKPEGPFGDHLGYYSLIHPFPVMQVKKVYAKKKAIWPFTVVGRPPQEDTSFGRLIHEITGDAIPREVPGILEVHAVDAAGVHPLLLAIGKERYTPYLKTTRPSELLTQANHILGTGQLSLAKYLFITADDTQQLSTHNIPDFFGYILKRINTERDIHFFTHTTIDTLDYSGTGLNMGSKVIFAAYGEEIRSLATELPDALKNNRLIQHSAMIMPGIAAIEISRYESEEKTLKEVEALNTLLTGQNLNHLPLIVICDDASFTAATLNNFLWVTFTRSNPSHDIHGIGAYYSHKHWSCKGPVLIDARIKPHHAPVLEKDPIVEDKITGILKRAGYSRI